MKHVVVDLEMNKVNRKLEKTGCCKMETIEIGAIMLDEDLKEISSFMTFVKPEFNDSINGKIRALTGITYEMVANAPEFNEALRSFANWCLEEGEDVEIHAWSETDYRQVKKEMTLKEYQIAEEEQELLMKEWSDFQKEFDSGLCFERLLSLRTALDMAGIEPVGKEHDALDDARNTAELLRVFHDKELFDATLRKIREVMEPSSHSFKISELFDFSQIAWE
jgi:ERI1 exoribonuclease 2